MCMISSLNQNACSGKWRTQVVNASDRPNNVPGYRVYCSSSYWRITPNLLVGEGRWDLHDLLKPL